MAELEWCVCVRQDLEQYVLDGHRAVPCPDLAEWGEWMETHDCRVARTCLFDALCVETCFLGLDHGVGADEPQLFETVVFRVDGAAGGPARLERYATWEAARAGHAAAVSRLRAAVRRASAAAVTSGRRRGPAAPEPGPRRPARATRGRGP